ncbi:hypothetical protein C8Q72DRAFT_891443 [Fomitopsis betulina]|nr:hypothetical protein C8Q72DRAFT_891443 [Fomitopsis betulina]
MPSTESNTSATAAAPNKKPTVQTKVGRPRSASQSTDSSGEYTFKVVGPDENEEDSPTMTLDEFYAMMMMMISAFISRNKQL